MDETKHTKELIRFALELYNSNIKESITEKLKLLIMDQIGLQIGCAQLPWCKTVYEYSKLFPSIGSSTIMYYGNKTSPENAAFINSTFGHGQDFDDTCLKVQTHPTAVILPVALAVGEDSRASGKQLLNAVAAGMEVMLRIAYSVSPGCLQRGHHTPLAVGPFGSAVTAGLLIGLSEEKLLNALGIAGSFSGGLIEYTQAGGSVKRIHTAIPTTAGIKAAYFAAIGMTGPKSVLEGKKGFCHVFSDTSDLSRLTENLYTEYLIEDVAVKLYNCCYFIHAPLEAVLEIVKENKLDYRCIKCIRIGISKHGTVHVGRIIEPHDELGAQFSIPFTISLSLLVGTPGIDAYSHNNIFNPKIRQCAKKIIVYEDPVCTKEYPNNWGAIVTVKMNNGTEYVQRKRYARGTPENPAGRDEITGKFLRNVSDKLSEYKRANLIKRILSMENIKRVSKIFDYCTETDAE